MHAEVLSFSQRMTGESSLLAPSHAVSVDGPWLAVGILSAPEYMRKRTVLRATCLSNLQEHGGATSPLDAQGVVVRFVIRNGGIIGRLKEKLDAEAARYKDTVCTNPTPPPSAACKCALHSPLGWCTPLSLPD